MMLYPDAKIMIFAKAPEAGQSKTRLIPAMGEEGAAELHKRMAQYIINNMLTAGIADIELHCYPDCQHAFFLHQPALHNIALHKQQGRHLGERMANAMMKALTQSRYAIIIGTDAPCLTPGYLLTAFEKLKSGTDVVIGPAEDGGYVLIGLSQYNPLLFENIDWGSEHVLQQTLGRIKKSNMSLHILDMKWDVDTVNDLSKLRNNNQLSFLLNNLEIQHEPKTA
jgi:uncharacterized protein